MKLIESPTCECAIPEGIWQPQPGASIAASSWQLPCRGMKMWMAACWERSRGRKAE